MPHIQIYTTKPRVQYVADGVQRSFQYPFAIFSEDNLEIYLGTKRQTDRYTVSGVGESAGGSVNFSDPPIAGSVVTLRRHLVIERTTDFQESGPFRAKVINDEFDYLTAAIQQLETETARTIRLDTTDAEAALVLPDAAGRAGKALAFDMQGALITRALSPVEASSAWRTLDDVPEGSETKHYRNVDQEKLSGIQVGAQVNPPLVSKNEKDQATLSDPRSFSPKDIADMIAASAVQSSIDGGIATSSYTLHLDGGRASA